MNWLLWSMGSWGEWFGAPYLASLASAAVAYLDFAAFERVEIESAAPATLTPT